MEARTALARSLILLAVVSLFQVAADASGAVARPEATAAQVLVVQAAAVFDVAGASDPFGEPVEASPTSSVAVRDGTVAERQRLDVALQRFGDLGLVLPDLEVVFDSTGTSCKGYRGLFQTDVSPWRVSICSEAGFVYEHELAHAWEAATLTDELRDEFMVLRGYSVWSDSAVPWSERGVEDAVFIIQQGLSGLPLPPDLFTEHRSRLAAFELLTGFPDPRLSEWEAARSDTVFDDPEASAARILPS